MQLKMSKPPLAPGNAHKAWGDFDLLGDNRRPPKKLPPDMNYRAAKLCRVIGPDDFLFCR
jgi:hypothetical protein